MSQARVATGVISALLVVGAVVHFRPAQKLTVDSFVSAALDIDTLPLCEAPNGPTDLATGAGGAAIVGTAAWAGTGAAAASTLFVQTKGPCVCGTTVGKKSICTNGRVCDPVLTGQCYLPKCPVDAAGVPQDIPTSYIAGCFCSAATSFTSSNKNIAYVGAPIADITKDCTDGQDATETCKCGTSVCYKGDACVSAGNADTCDGVKKPPQTVAYAVPSISSNVFTNPKLFAICKSTAAATKKCKLPDPPATQNEEAEPVTCEAGR